MIQSMLSREVLLHFLFVTGVGFLSYYVLINTIYMLIHMAAMFRLRKVMKRPDIETIYSTLTSPFLPGVAILVPAYNESAVIEDTVRSLLDLNYPNKEIVVINDGSDDDTLQRLQDEFQLTRTKASLPFETNSEPIKDVFMCDNYPELLVVDKENGGKSDALNAGLWLTEQPLFGAIDADSLIDPDGLSKVLRPFVEHPEQTVAAGGSVHVANGCDIENGRVKNIKLPDNTLGEIQVMEYLRAFYSGRLGLAEIGSLVLISGAFGVFRTDLVREIGGYDTESITEDFDLVVRLHRHLTEIDRDYRIDFVPDPVVWTEVPEDIPTLSRQRRRWFRGMVDTLETHRDIIGSRKYGRAGLIGLPMKFFGEAMGRLMEGMGYVLLPIALLAGAISVKFLLVYFFLTVSIGTFLSWFGIFSEVWGFRRYEDPRQIVRLLGAGVLENLGYRQWRTLVAWRGLWEYFRGVNSWGTMARSSFGRTPIDPREDV